uniref:Uncharacterized protein n=1 Tax=Aegilops tauschii subsp. strangulata TaxID=200361 RepID=A0A453PDQ2_AEGTS
MRGEAEPAARAGAADAGHPRSPDPHDLSDDPDYADAASVPASIHAVPLALPRLPLSRYRFRFLPSAVWRLGLGPGADESIGWLGRSLAGSVSPEDGV